MKNRFKNATEHKKRRPLSLHMQQRLREGFFLASIAFAIFLLISLSTYQQSDPAWSSTGASMHIANWGGRVGAFIADIFLSLIGIVAYIFPFLMMLSSWLSINRTEIILRKTRERFLHFFGWLLFIASACAIVSFYVHDFIKLPAHSGGMIGDLVSHGFKLLFNKTGSTLILVTTLFFGITLITGLSWLGLIESVGALSQRWFIIFYQSVKKFISTYSQRYTLKKSKSETAKNEKTAKEKAKPPLIAHERNEPLLPLNLATSPVLAKEPSPEAALVLAPPIKKLAEVELKVKLQPGTLPAYSLLNPSHSSSAQAFSNISFETLSALVEQRLAEFGVEVKVTAVYPGPVVTRFELELAAGIKVSKVTGLAKDIARSLSIVSVRVVEVIPGKSVIGLEIPNENREVVSLRELLESERYQHSTSPTSLVLGKDIAGHPIVADLAKMPHLLVAGTTGSGKSVGLNAMLLSMLFKASPEELRLILIDPKMLELSVYEGIPHLLTPVITDMKDAANALRWCVAEMDKRYRLMAALGVRNLAGYNQKIEEANRLGEPLLMPGALVTDEATAKTHLSALPIIVVIADELADMMMVVGKKVEDLIARIAQKARAAGIHLILATQRPSVDVITGLIKANVPTRIAFQVSSRIDSRTILDQQGAEQLLGHGDMLYLPPGAGIPIRVHGAYVADEEVHRVVAAWRSYGQPTYLNDVTQDAAEMSSDEVPASGERDPLYDQAVNIVTESRRASISLVQRRLRVGYNRAARMMEEMEAAGIVSAMDNNGSREVLAAAAPID